MFNENSGLVKAWVNLVGEGIYTLDDVPQLSNLREVVTSLVALHEAVSELLEQ